MYPVTENEENILIVFFEQRAMPFMPSSLYIHIHRLQILCIGRKVFLTHQEDSLRGYGVEILPPVLSVALSLMEVYITLALNTMFIVYSYTLAASLACARVTLLICSRVSREWGRGVGREGVYPGNLAN